MKQRVYITKYVFSKGILEGEMEVNLDTESCRGKLDGCAFTSVFYGNDFHLTKKDAIRDFEERRKKKIIRLQKYIIELAKLSFETDNS